jgi:hypothetical protein
MDPSCIGGSDYINEVWDLLDEFEASRLEAEIPYDAIPPAILLPKPTPTVPPPPATSQGQVQVFVYVDKNSNQQPDAGEWVNNLQVVLTFNDGSSVSGNTQEGMVTFDVSGKEINSRAVVTLPVLFQSKNVIIPESGTVPVIFQLQQSELLPVLP